MESKLLDLNLDKSCYILVGKYLGDYLHSEGSAASVECTISHRAGRTTSSIVETRAIIDDSRVNTVGGLVAGLDIWELAIIPFLLNNCQTWLNISGKSIQKLEDLQNNMYRTLLNVPKTCPTPSLCWDMGGTQIKFRIIAKKLEFLWHLLHLEDGALAKDILTAQKNQRMPGLVQECDEWIENLNLPNIFKEDITKTQWKNLIKKKIKEENEKDLKSKMKNYSKLKNSELMDEEFGMRVYLKNLNVHDARMIYMKRSSMMQYVKMNYMNDLKNMKSMWQCDSCQRSIDSMNHVLWCPSYKNLREEKNLENDKDLAKYLHDVFKIRNNLDIDR